MKTTTKSVNGTSFHGTTIKSSITNLKKILGEPRYSDNNGKDKVNFNWVMETNDGNVFTVYDWKEYRSLTEDEIIEWHIGGYGKRITEMAKDEIIEFYRHK